MKNQSKIISKESIILNQSKIILSMITITFIIDSEVEGFTLN
jgi:hypothetical protein